VRLSRGTRIAAAGSKAQIAPLEDLMLKPLVEVPSIGV